MEEDLGPDAPAPAEESFPPEIPTAPVRPTWSDLWKAVALIWCAQLVNNIGVGVFVAASHMLSGKSGLPRPETWVLISGSLVDWVITVCVIVYFAVWKYGTTFRDAFYVRGVPPGVIVSSIALGVGGSIAATTLMTIWGTNEAPMYDIVFDESEDGVVQMSLLFALFAVLVPPLEELYYRGFLFPILKRSLNATAAIVIVSVWFLSIHIPQIFGEWAAVVVIGCMSVIWTLQRHRYDSLVPSLISHWTYNVCIIGVQLVADRMQQG